MGKVRKKGNKALSHSVPSATGNVERPEPSTNWELLKKELAASSSTSSNKQPSRSAIKNRDKRLRRQQKAKEALTATIQNSSSTFSSASGGATTQHNKWAHQRAQIDSYIGSIHRQAAPGEHKATHGHRARAIPSSGDTSSPTPSSHTNILALDCEYVGVGYKGEEDSLARVSLVDANGECIYDKYVRPTEPVVDYRTEVSGIRPGMLKNGEPFAKVQQEVHSMLNAAGTAGQRCILVGHAIHNDFKVLRLTYPTRFVRDTAKWKPLRAMCPGLMTHKMPKLKELAYHLLGVQIQQGEHDSVADARMALRIYLLHRQKWESEFKQQVRSVKAAKEGAKKKTKLAKALMV